MTLAVVRPDRKEKGANKDAVIFAGVSADEVSIAAGSNEHFRTFDVELPHTAIIPTSRHQLFAPTSAKDQYQRVLRVNGPLAAIASGAGGVTKEAEIVVFSSHDFAVLRRIPTDVEVADLDLFTSTTCTSLVYCTRKEIYTLVPANNSAAPTKVPLAPQPGALRGVRFLSATRILVAYNKPSRTGAELLLVDAATGSIISRRSLHNSIGAITSLDATPLSPISAVAAVSGADSSVEILAVDNDRFKGAGTHRNIDPFQITKLVFSPPPPPPTTDSTTLFDADDSAFIRLATSSMSNAVVVFTLPLLKSKRGWKLLRAGSVAKQTCISVLLSLIAVLVFAVVLQMVFVSRGGLTDEVERRWDEVRNGINEVVHNMRGEGVNEEAVEALLKGMKSGSATDPFEGGDGFDAEELRRMGQEKVEEVVHHQDDTQKAEL